MPKTLGVDCTHIKKTYKNGDEINVVLKDINLKIETGELLMIVGPSGCGKTTLLSIIGGLLNCDQGSCKIYGAPVTNMTTEEKTIFRSQNVGFVFQDFGLFPTLTAGENISLPLIITGVEAKVAKQRAAKILSDFELGDKLSAFPAHLSGGQQQRVSIARALIHDPKLVLCDEPTSAIDKEEGHRVLTLLKKITANKSKTVVVVTHDPRIYSFADRIALMDDGIITKITRKLSMNE